MPAPPPSPWPVSQDLATLAGRAGSLSRGGGDAGLAGLAAALLRIQPVARELECSPPGGTEPPAAALRAWLDDLRVAAADAEELLDDLHRRRLAGPAISTCVGAALRSPARKLRRLAERLDSARDDSERLRPFGSSVGCGVRSPNRVTGSVLAERRVFGRDKECDDVIGRSYQIPRCSLNVKSLVASGSVNMRSLIVKLKASFINDELQRDNEPWLNATLF